jgi:hypothetical protein
MFSDLVEYKGVFILYMIISANFLANTFGCNVQRLLNNNMYAKHLVGFFTLYFFVTLTSNTNITDDQFIFFKKFGASILLYIIFIFSTRAKGMFFNIFFSLIGVNYLIRTYADSLDKKKYKDRIDGALDFATWCGRISLIVLIIGVILYYLEQKAEYKNSFNMGTFIFGNVNCKNK